MSNSDERREVAARLRGLDVEITSHDTLERAVDKFMKAVCGERPFSPIRYSVRNLCGIGYVLSGLIDPTCNDASHSDVDFKCSACGAYTEFPTRMGAEIGWVEGSGSHFDYCPCCGSRVVSDDGE